MTRLIIYPYKVGSKGAQALARGLNTRSVFPNGRYRPRLNDVIITWGMSQAPTTWRPSTQRMLNHWSDVTIAHNKILTFRAWERFAERIPLSYVPFTESSHTAQQWLQQGAKVVCRGSVTGHSGVGITIVSGQTSLPYVGLYTKYIPKKKEFRVHVINGRIIDIQQKRKRLDIPREQIDYQVRAHHKGWVFCRDGIEEPSDLRTTALHAIEALNLDFGAVDIIWNEKQNKSYALEVNTAPGLEGQTLTNYIQAFSAYVRR